MSDCSGDHTLPCLALVNIVAHLSYAKNTIGYASLTTLSFLIEHKMDKATAPGHAIFLSSEITKGKGQPIAFLWCVVALLMKRWPSAMSDVLEVRGAL